MSSVQRLQFIAPAHAPARRVCRTMSGPAPCRDWTSACVEGSCFAGSWDHGQRIRFLSPAGDGMVAAIAENSSDEFISIRRLGFIAQGVEDTVSGSVGAWTPALARLEALCEHGHAS
jgi:hypothetical protein